MPKKVLETRMLIPIICAGFLGSTTAYSVPSDECYFDCGDKQEDCVINEYIGYHNKHWKKICKDKFEECIRDCPDKK